MGTIRIRESESPRLMNSGTATGATAGTVGVTTMGRFGARVDGVGCEPNRLIPVVVAIDCNAAVCVGTPCVSRAVLGPVGAGVRAATGTDAVTGRVASSGASSSAVADANEIDPMTRMTIPVISTITHGAADLVSHERHRVPCRCRSGDEFDGVITPLIRCSACER